MNRLIVFIAFVILFVSLSSTAEAAIISKSNQTISINVLGAQDSNALQNITNSLENIVSKVSLNIEDNQLVLSYDDEIINDRQFSLENFEGEVIEVKKQSESDSLYVIAEDNKYFLQQRGISVATIYPVEVGSELENLTLQTASGNRYLSILPYDAVSPLLRTNMIDELNREGSIELIELDAGELAYYIQGEKKHNLFDLMSLNADVKISVSALNGKVLSIDQPTWSRVLSFLRV